MIQKLRYWLAGLLIGAKIEPAQNGSGGTKPVIR